MKILKNSYDSEVEFDNLEDAKRYHMPDLAELPECAEYAKEIESAESLEELADVLNEYTDRFGNGSAYTVKEI